MADDNYIKQLIEMIKKDYGSIHNYNKACMGEQWDADPSEDEKPLYAPKEYFQKAFRQRKRLQFDNESELLFRDHKQEPLRGLQMNEIARDEATQLESLDKVFPGRTVSWYRYVEGDDDDTPL